MIRLKPIICKACVHNNFSLAENKIITTTLGCFLFVGCFFQWIGMKLIIFLFLKHHNYYYWSYPSTEVRSTFGWILMY